MNGLSLRRKGGARVGTPFMGVRPLGQGATSGLGGCPAKKVSGFQVRRWAVRWGVR